MKIDIETVEECVGLMNLINNYNSKIEITDDVSDIISNIMLAIDQFRINDSFGLIGPINCVKCDKHWIAILSEKVKKVECPTCGFMNMMPKFI